jgi:citrate lyase gamma subunit
MKAVKDAGAAVKVQDRGVLERTLRARPGTAMERDVGRHERFRP